MFCLLAFFNVSPTSLTQHDAPKSLHCSIRDDECRVRMGMLYVRNRSAGAGLQIMGAKVYKIFHIPKPDIDYLTLRQAPSFLQNFIMDT
jgi:hypothetical protein